MKYTYSFKHKGRLDNYDNRPALETGKEVPWKEIIPVQWGEDFNPDISKVLWNSKEEAI